MKKEETYINPNSISIEWIGAVDKPIPKLIMCSDCADDADVLKVHRYKVSPNSLTEVDGIFFGNKKNESAVKINEENKKKYLPQLNKVLSVLKKNKENELLINDVKTFIVRIDY